MKKKVILSMILAAVVFTIGLTFQYVVEANDGSTSNLLLAISNETTETVTTGVKGYYYIVNEDSSNSDFDITTATFIVNSVSLDLSNNGKYIHMKAVDVAGNVGNPAVAKIEVMSKVSINLDGGKLKGDPNPEPKTGLAGSTIDLGIPEKDGYVFDGWIPIVGDIDGTNYTYPVEEDQVTAKWVKDSFNYKVEYYYNDVKDDTKTETTKVEFETVIENYTGKPVAGYQFDRVENLPLTVSSNPENNVIKVYYITDASQTKSNL